MKLIVGLGNYPKEYSLTRHNIGFMMIDYIYRYGFFDRWQENKKMICNICSGNIFDVDCFLVKPNTYMNLSGDSVLRVIKFYKIKPENLIVIHDELDLDFGTIKVTESRNSAGHNGIKSINSVINEPYKRIRIGIGRPENDEVDISNYVLSKFTALEKEKIDTEIGEKVINYISDLIK